MITRDDYINGSATHGEYYGQFVTPAVRRILLECIAASADEHFNDIPLEQWDNLPLPLRTQHQLAEANGTGGFSLSDKVCIFKEAARTMTATADLYRFGHDSNGNPISHFTIHQGGRLIAQTNRRRQQTGYRDDFSEAVLAKLYEATGGLWKVTQVTGSRSEDHITLRLERDV